MGKRYIALIVDDQSNNRLLLRKIMANARYDILEAVNGKEGLETARLQRPDVIISDVLMPVMDGFLFCKEVKKDEELRNIPFVFYTATYVDKKDETFALSLGAEKYLIKPLEPDVLINLIKNIIEKYSKGDVVVPKKAIEAEEEVFKQYSERLVNKLEKKMLDLEKEMTKRKQAQKTLQEIELKLSTHLQNTSIGAISWDLNFKAMEWNPAAEKIFGYSRTEAMGRHVTDLILPLDLKGVGDGILQDLISGKGGGHSINENITKDSSRITCDWYNTVLKDAGGKVIGIASLVHDITERLQTEEALKESELKFRLLADYTIDWEFWIGPEGENIYVSPSCERITGYSPEELISDPQLVLKMVKPGYAEKVQHHYFDEKNEVTPVFSMEFPITTKNGEEVWLEHNCSPVFDDQGKYAGRRGNNRDITKRRLAEEEKAQVEEQFRQAQKMESVGRLAGGVAHDFNNALSVIMSTTELVIDDVTPTGQLREDLDEILMAGKRAADITRQLLAFARKQTIDPKILDLNECVESMLKMFRRLIGEDIDLAWLSGANLWSVKMDSTQIHQILANLCVNARDAIEGVGKVTIESGNVSLTEDYCFNHKGFVPGEFVQLSVSDNGCGMEKEILDNIFEPFFTTKDVDKGTGLGLATVYGIAKQNNGFINVYSEPDKGTTIKIYLPRHGAKAVETHEEITEEIPPGQGETILVVEDDFSILNIMEKILQRLGYKVLTSNAPEKVKDMVKEYNSEIHLLITDVVMPKMNGRDLAKQLQSICPDLKCLFMSGYTADGIANQGVLDKEVNFIQKPFSKRELAEIVRKMLDQN
jgi:two-component system, cell cycle sensor histidine kinase and response regulator CckA